MSLKQKYTWHDFKREKGKEAEGLKRTSPEGKKVFEAAKTAKLKEFLKKRTSDFEKEKQKVEKKLQGLKDSLKGLKAPLRKKTFTKRIVQSEHQIRDLKAALSRDQSRNL